jgi:hypothetical protein
MNIGWIETSTHGADREVPSKKYLQPERIDEEK